MLECISAKELHTQAPTAFDIDKIKYSPQAYPISGTSPHCGHGFKSSIATTSVAGVLLKCGGGLCHNALDARARHDFASLCAGQTWHAPSLPDPQISAASISCSSVRFFIMFNLLCQSAFKRAVITRIFTSADFLTLETAVIPTTVVAVEMCAHQDSGFLFIHRPPPPFLHSSKLYTVPDPLRKQRSTGSFHRSS